jgi:GDPmannose 4,6-dehydratase
MAKKRALITGISGQDGYYLTKLLLEKDYEVFGTIRRSSVQENEYTRLTPFKDKITLIHADLLDMGSLSRAVDQSDPDEIYNLGAQSHVGISFTQPVYTAKTITLGTLYLLEIIKQFYPHVKFYQASSSEMFGNEKDIDGFQRETTKMTPASPYGTAKLAAHNLVRNYRDSYNIFACCGILFNHESPRRGTNFVTKKIVNSALQIKNGELDKLELGNLSAQRDWGHAADYVKAMWMMLQHDEPSDYICATGVTHSVLNICEHVFGKLGLAYTDYVVSVDKFQRPNELNYLKGDYTKLRKTLNWNPAYTFEDILDEMIYG